MIPSRPYRKFDLCKPISTAEVLQDTGWEMSQENVEYVDPAEALEAAGLGE